MITGCSGPDASLLKRPGGRDAGRQDGATGGGPPVSPGRDGGPVGPPVGRADAAANDDDGGGLPMSIDCDADEEFAVCTRPNADSACLDDRCLIVRCLGDYVDCDGDADNGCETTLATVDHCGRCGAGCSLPHVHSHACELVEGSGRCDIDRECPASATACQPDAPTAGCDEGYGDCDGRADTGCETRLDTRNDCGACGASCRSDTSMRACVDGRCQIVGCAPGSGDCDETGCKSLASDPRNCGTCGEACPAEAPVCAGGRCTGLTCTGDLADCNGDVADDCEADLGSTATCGSCDNACPAYAHATAGCSDGTCVIDRCDSDWDDCDAEDDNGCETDLTNVRSCGRCGNDCAALPHVASATCGASGCDLTCQTGWADCNGDSGDGCEQALNTLTSCGACGRVCAGAQATVSCASGTCELTACNEGFDDCNGTVEDGCEASLASPSTCGGCGNDCGPGGACVNNACECATSDGCPAGRSCCDGGCVNTRSDCFPWPCIPGTVADRFNCGACGQACLLFCCLIP